MGKVGLDLYSKKKHLTRFELYHHAPFLRSGITKSDFYIISTFVPGSELYWSLVSILFIKKLAGNLLSRGV